MKILQVAPAYYPAISIGGPIYSMLAFTRLLKACGHTVEVVSSPLGLSTEQRSALRFGEWHHRIDDVFIIYFPYYGYPNLTFTPALVPWLLRHIDDYDLVIMHGVWNFPIVAAADLCRVKKVPYVILPHGTLYKETVELKSLYLKRVMFRLFAKRALAHATKVLFTTEDERRKVLAYLDMPMRTHVLPNVVASAEFEQLPGRGGFRCRHGIPPDAKVIIHYGRIARKKGIEFTIRALPRLVKTFPDLVFVIAGGEDDAAYRSQIDALIEDLGVARHVRYTGLLERPEGLEALVDADVYVLPSLSENFGMSVVEAMLCEVPVVISEHVGIAPEVAAAQAGLVVSIEAQEDLAAALLNLLANPDEARAMAGRAKRFAIRQYDAPSVKAGLEALLGMAAAAPSTKDAALAHRSER